jgi:hypothetical protein
MRVVADAEGRKGSARKWSISYVQFCTYTTPPLKVLKVFVQKCFLTFYDCIRC